MMSSDSKLATLYKDTLHQIKLDKEFDYNNLERIHKQFDEFKDADKTFNKPKSKLDLEDKEY